MTETGPRPRRAACAWRRRRRARAGVATFAGAVRAGIGGALGLALAAAPADAQRRLADRYEAQMLREASALESRGALEAAEAKLRELARLRPGSSSAVFALERVLRGAGRLAALPPFAEAHLEANPGAASVRSMELRVLGELDSAVALDDAARRWIRADGATHRPYLEGARAYMAAGRLESAAALLREGLDALGRRPALLMALGDVHVDAARFADAAEAWADAIGSDRVRSKEVHDRLDRLEAGRDEVAGALISALRAPPASMSRLEAGAELALREGREEEARAVAAGVLPRLDGVEARGFLRGFARRAEDLGLHATAVWAYERLRSTAAEPADARRSDERIAAVAAAAGDTAVAAAAMKRVRESHPPQSPERRKAWAREIRFRLASDGPQAGLRAVSALRREFPGAPELDGLAAAVAAALVKAGEREAALEALDGAGPGAGLERGFLLLEAGALTEALEALRGAVPGMEPVAATDVLGLLAAMSRLGPAGGRLAARVAVLGRRGSAEEAVQVVEEGIGGVPATDRPPVLALAARTADAGGLAEAAAAFRRRIVSGHADAIEFPEAAVRLAKALAERPGGAGEAVRILEDLIVARPTSAVVPEARRVLNRLRDLEPRLEDRP